MCGSVTDMMSGMGASMMVLWALAGTVTLVLATIGLVRVTQTLTEHRREEITDVNPREMLRRRYAAGEIDEDEYLRRLSGLSQR
jgi:putative membrane protein